MKKVYKHWFVTFHRGVCDFWPWCAGWMELKA